MKYILICIHHILHVDEISFLHSLGCFQFLFLKDTRDNPGNELSAIISFPIKEMKFHVDERKVISGYVIIRNFAEGFLRGRIGKVIAFECRVSIYEHLQALPCPRVKQNGGKRHVCPDNILDPVVFHAAVV